MSLLAARPVQPTNAGPSFGIAWQVDTNVTIAHPTPLDQIRDSAGQIFATIGALFAHKGDIGVQQLGGPVMIARVYYNLFQDEDGWRRVLWFSVILNVNLALLNLLPLPVLDGGHIMLSLLEAIRRRPVSAQLLNNIQTGFAALLIAFMVYIVFFDTGDWIRSARSEREQPSSLRRQNNLSDMRYCDSPYFYHRRRTREIVIGDPARGGVIMGGDHPVVKQSMLTCDTMDTAECVKQTLDLVAVGCQLVRITAPTVKDAANLQHIVAELRQRGCLVPIVADIHFKPEAAMEAVKWVEMVRVNPGNYADSKKFAIKEYTDEQYAAELKRIEEKFTPLVLECKRLKRGLRIGTNHGSLSDRIMNRYGDTPLGMVESALEFARICRQHDFHNFKFSMKSSNPKVMIECYRLLVARLEQEGPDWNYPIHLGVTEAGEGEDGRIKSAIGIGSLLCDGLGDTIRVSLTEDSPHEIAVCRDLLAQIPSSHFRRAVPRAPNRIETSKSSWARRARPSKRFSFRPVPFRAARDAGNRTGGWRQMRRRTTHPRGGHPGHVGQGGAARSGPRMT